MVQNTTILSYNLSKTKKRSLIRYLSHIKIVSGLLNRSIDFKYTFSFPGSFLLNLFIFSFLF